MVTIFTQRLRADFQITHVQEQNLSPTKNSTSYTTLANFQLHCKRRLKHLTNNLPRLRVPNIPGVPHSTSSPDRKSPPLAGGEVIINSTVMDSELHRKVPHLLRLGLGHAFTVSASTVDLQVNITPKSRGKDVMVTVPFLTEIVVALEVEPQREEVSVEVLFPVTLAEVAPKVLLSQVHVQGVIVQVTLVTELTDWVSLMRPVICITIPAMGSQY